MRYDLRLLSLFVREATATALFVCLWPLGLARRLPRPGAETPIHAVPVLLVTGFRANRVWLAFLRTYLVHRGFGWTHVVAHRGGDRGIADLADDLAREVDTLRRLSGAPRVDVVGHSLGGLVAAWYVRHLEGDRAVRRLVTLATPWRGTRMAVFTPGRIPRELTPGGHLLDDLAPPRVPTIAVWSPDDARIIPADSALPDGAESIRIEGAGHNDMLLSGRVFRAVEAALLRPDAAEGAA